MLYRINGFVNTIAETCTDITVSVGDTLIQISDSIGETVDDSVDYTKEKCAKIWSATTGKDTFDEAEKLLENITKNYEIEITNYNSQFKTLSDSIEEHLSKINYHKQDIYQKYFYKFTGLANRLHNLSIEGKEFLEYFDNSILELKCTAGVSNKSELYTIDFNNLSFKDTTLGILTLGFLTRKQASETLSKVQGEEERLQSNVIILKAHIEKLEKVYTSIKNVEEYFTVLVQNYSKLLDRFEFGIQSQLQKNLLKGISLTNGKLNFKMMPIAHIEEFQALFNLSIVLKTMATMGYLTEFGDLNKDELATFDKIKELSIKTQLLAA